MLNTLCLFGEDLSEVKIEGLVLDKGPGPRPLYFLPVPEDRTIRLPFSSQPFSTQVPYCNFQKPSAEASVLFTGCLQNESEVLSTRLPGFKSSSRECLVPRQQLSKAESGNLSSRDLASLHH